MKNQIFKPFFFFVLSSTFIFSCNKKQVATRSYEDIKWHSNTSPFSAAKGVDELEIKPEIVAPANVDQSTFTKEEVKENTLNTLELPVTSKEELGSKLSGKEKKQVRKEIKESLQTTETEMNTLLLVIIAIILPPIAVGLVRGWTSGAFFLNILLTLLFYVPGLIHALVIVLGRNNS